MSEHHNEPHYRPPREGHAGQPHHAHQAPSEHSAVAPRDPHHERHTAPRRSGGWLWAAVALVALVAVAIGGVVAWRSVASGASAHSSAKQIGTVGVYFPAGEALVKVTRPVYAGQTPERAAALGLLAGPTPAEAKKGLTTNIPEGVTLGSVESTVDPKTGKRDLVVHVSGTFGDPTSRDPAEARLESEARLDQVAYTMRQFRQIATIRVIAGGRKFEVPTLDEVERPGHVEPDIDDTAAAAPRSMPTVSPASYKSAKQAPSRVITDIQKKLAELTYLPVDAVTGKNDYRTQQAVMAFQAWEGLTRDGDAGPKTVDALKTATAPVPKNAGDASGPSAQVYRNLGVALFLQDGKLVRAIHVSTGKPGFETPSGDYAIYNKELRHWSTQYDCWLPYASFFNEGYAFHEYPEVPPYPGSHGCCRVPSPEAKWVYDLMTMGAPVHVY